MRGTILQPWNWHTPETDSEGLRLWERIKRDAANIKAQGYTAVWLPPASMAWTFNGEKGVGYSISHWSEFDDTKYGDKEDLVQACKALQEQNIQVYHDIVHNHLIGGEQEEGIWCLHVKQNNKNEPAFPGAQWHQRNIHTLFPALGLDHDHFDAVHDEYGNCYAITGKTFDREAAQDPLLGSDLDFDNIDLIEKLKFHGKKNLDEIHTDGYRYDAVKHIRPKGTKTFHHSMQTHANRNLFGLGEFSDSRIHELHNYIANTSGIFSLYDFPLQRKMVHASIVRDHFDMGSIFQNTLVKEQPVLAVTFVHSHDDMPPIHDQDPRGEYIGDWFISQAYALILLRDEGYPVVSNVDTIRHKDMLKRYMLLRTHCTYGERFDRFDHYHTVGWSFTGNSPYDNSMAVVMTNGTVEGSKWLKTGKPFTSYRDFTDTRAEVVTTNTDGWAEFKCSRENTSAWVEESKYHSLKEQLSELD
ncbi:alpha-amylase family glycosyl hydrolase [Rapidithrix thailandica]|uniref:Alpha-amylase family glycosyl hydrolase n=1 Tax=Rapidithrix thailandica TaxID=413964 RepID=A0AAW9SHF8_9BACT